MTAHSIAPWIKFDEKLWFDPKVYSGCRRRKHPLKVSVNHWTAGYSNKPAKAVFNTLKNRKPDKLSIHFVIDGDGVVWQMADCEKTVCFHAGAVNDFSIGTEIMLRGVWPPLPKDRQDLKKITYAYPIQGKSLDQIQFLPQQIEAVIKLSDVITSEFGIKPQIPCDANGNITNKVLPNSVRPQLEGFIEHLHVSSKKKDCGTQISQALLATGRYSLVKP